MLGPTFSAAFETLGLRWKAILGSVVASAALMLVLVVVLVVPAAKGLMPTENVVVPNATMVDPATGVEVPDASVVDASGGDPATAPTEQVPFDEAQGSALAMPGAGDVAKFGVAMLILMLVSISMMTTGVFAAAGHSVGQSIRLGATTSPHAIVQSVRIAWPAMALYVVGFVLMLAVGPLVGVLPMLAGAVMGIRVSGTVWLAIGSIAHGHVGWSPAAAREAAAGRMWSASGVAFVGSLAGGVANLVPILGAVLGPMFMSAFMSAMWEQYGGSTGGPGGETGDTSDGPGVHGEHGAVGSSHAEPARAAEASQAAPAVAAAAAAPATAPLEAGPTWNGVASQAEPLGQWINLAHPAQVALQAQWTTGTPPTVQLADQAGAWTTPAAQPTTSGETAWLQLAAGWTWVALVPRDPQQQLWVTTWVPAGSLAAAA